MISIFSYVKLIDKLAALRVGEYMDWPEGMTAAVKGWYLVRNVKPAINSFLSEPYMSNREWLFHEQRRLIKARREKLTP